MDRQDSEAGGSPSPIQGKSMLLGIPVTAFRVSQGCSWEVPLKPAPDVTDVTALAVALRISLSPLGDFQ